MAEIVGQILKSEEVKLEGQVQLNAARPQPTPVPLGGKNGGRLTANIVENQPEFAIIEITCCCGARTYLRCEYER
ncbi:MAG: hypothetical protein ACE5NM_02430 [Sedimentisphaerales bacterium]